MGIIVAKLDTIKKIYIFLASISSKISKERKGEKKGKLLLQNVHVENVQKYGEEGVALFYAIEV